MHLSHLRQISQTRKRTHRIQRLTAYVGKIFSGGSFSSMLSMPGGGDSSRGSGLFTGTLGVASGPDGFEDKRLESSDKVSSPQFPLVSFLLSIAL